MLSYSGLFSRLFIRKAVITQAPIETGEKETSHNPEFDSSLQVVHFAVETYIFVKNKMKKEKTVM